MISVGNWRLVCDPLPLYIIQNSQAAGLGRQKLCHVKAVLEHEHSHRDGQMSGLVIQCTSCISTQVTDKSQGPAVSELRSG